MEGMNVSHDSHSRDDMPSVQGKPEDWKDFPPQPELIPVGESPEMPSADPTVVRDTLNDLVEKDEHREREIEQIKRRRRLN